MSWVRRVLRFDPRLDMEAVARIGGRARRRSIERGAGKMLGLLDQRNQRWRVAGDPGYLQLAAGQMQFGDVGMIRKHLAQRLEHDHAGRRFILAPLERCDRRAVGAVAANTNGGAPLRSLPVSYTHLT